METNFATKAAAPRPLKGLINNSEKTGNQETEECFSVSSEPEILLGKTPEAVNDIPETGANETIILGAASTSLDEMPATEKYLNETLYLKKMCRSRNGSFRVRRQKSSTSVKCFLT